MRHSLKFRMVQSSQKTYASPQFGDKFLKQLFECMNNYYCLLLNNNNYYYCTESARSYFATRWPASRTGRCDSPCRDGQQHARNTKGGLLPSRNLNADSDSPAARPLGGTGG